MIKIGPSVEVIDEPNILRKIELAGRVCYKSEGNIGPGSDVKLISKLIASGHEAMVEHGVFVVNLDKHLYKGVIELPLEILKFMNLTPRVLSFNVRAIRDAQKAYPNIWLAAIITNIIETYPDYAVLFNDLKLDFSSIKSQGLNKQVSIVTDLKNGLTETEKKVHLYITLKMICDRGVTHEIVRHRIASYAQESTRYCNYAKDKFGNQITVIDPTTGFGWDLSNPDHREKYWIWQAHMHMCETNYMMMIEAGATPQEARSILPNSLKTEIIMTANIKEWDHFFSLRTAPAAHPSMREVANLAKQKIDEYLLVK